MPSSALRSSKTLRSSPPRIKVKTTSFTSLEVGLMLAASVTARANNMLDLTLGQPMLHSRTVLPSKGMSPETLVLTEAGESRRECACEVLATGTCTG